MLYIMKSGANLSDILVNIIHRNTPVVISKNDQIPKTKQNSNALLPNKFLLPTGFFL